MPDGDRVVCVVQARMGSSRLPGKVLMELGGVPMLELLLRRLAPIDLGGTVVATTDRPLDDPIAELCASQSVPVVRGSESDVLSRFIAVLDRHDADHVVRITADCPLSDPALVQSVVSLHLERGADYTSNVWPRTFPRGLDVEVATADALRTAAAEAVHPAEREHVTPFLYRHPERFRMANLRSPADRSDLSWTVDTSGDLERVRALVERGLGRAQSVDVASIGWQTLLASEGDPTRPPTIGLRSASAADSDSLLRWRNDRSSVDYSRSQQTVTADEHERWLASTLEDPGVELFIIESHGTAVGMLRVDVRDAEGLVSIAVDPARRGHGLGRAALGLLTARTAEGVRCDRLLAEVHCDNIASRSIFEEAGFVPTGVDGSFISHTWVAGNQVRPTDGAPG